MSRESFRIAKGLRVGLAAACPLLAAGAAWFAWTLFQDRLGGRAADNPWLFALLLAALAGALVFLGALLVLAWRARIDLREDGFDLRGLLRTRTVPWRLVEGYRWLNGQMNVYLAEDEWPLNLAHFERRGPLGAWFAARVPDLHAEELRREAREIHADVALGFTDEQKRARLGALRSLVRMVSWPGYAAAAIGGANALFLGREDVQLAAACVLIAVPPVLVLLAIGHRGQIRIGPAQGSAYPDALPGILAASLALGLIALLDPHTLLGDRFARWAVPFGALLAGLWLAFERDRLLEHARSYAGVVIVTALSTSTTKAGRLHHVTVAPWPASREAVKLDVPRATWKSLRVGALVRVAVRRGALGIPWVSAVRRLRPRR
jgi:hypothetical protein